jgi:hypothetical protein
MVAKVILSERKAYVYIDGVERSTDTYTGNLVDYNTNLGIGGAYRYFQGYLDDAQLYRRALTADEIAAIYNKTKGRYQ